MSFFTSLSGLRNAEIDLRVISHNIANAETVGFKKSSAQFADLVAKGSGADPRRTPGLGATVSAITQDFALGPLEQTGRSLDLAIDGDGFFALADPISGDLSFSRNGNFRLQATGALQDATGNSLQAFPVDATGTATSNVPANVVVPLTNAAGSALNNVTIDNRGVISASYADGTATPVGQVALAVFGAPTGLRAIGQTKWQASGESGPPAFGSPGIGNYGGMISGALERSNVELAEEMVSLLTAQRNFQANARAIDTATVITQAAINLRQQ
jgi:flagellar hook protein FlgE